MAAIIKSQAEREKIRETGHIVAQVLAELRAAVRPGITTIELDRLAVEVLKQRGAKSSSLGYHGYPKSVCTSVNDEVVHGIPGEQVLQEGDIVSIDFAAVYNGWHADSAITVAVGTVSPEVQHLLKVTEDALYRGIAAARAGNRLNDISRAVQEYVEAEGFSVVGVYGGHDVGGSMHEERQVRTYIEPGRSNRMVKMVGVVGVEDMVGCGTD